MESELIKWIFDNIPLLLQYFVPGYVSLIIFTYFTSKKAQNNTSYVMGCVLSYVLLSFVSLIRANTIILSGIPNSAMGNSAIAIILGICFSVLTALIFSNKHFSRLTVYLFQKTPNDSIWSDVLDLKNGSNLKIYLKNKDYYVIGHHKNHEENGNDSWIAISAFGKFDIRTNQLLRHEPSYLNNPKVIFAVRLSDVEHIEIF